MFSINKDSQIPIYMQIYTQAVEAIQNGTLLKGEKLQSIRELAKVVGVSVKTIKSAYEQLLLEGYIESRERSGYFVSFIEHEFQTEISPTQKITISSKQYQNTGNTDDSFDQSTFTKIRNYISRETENLGKDSLINGEQSLRQEVIRFVAKYRNVNAHYNQVVIANNTRTLLQMILSLIDNPVIAYEEPGYEKAERVFKSYRIPCYPISTKETGIDFNQLKKSDANIVYVTPTQQYPTGNIMSINERLKLLNWANNNQAFLIEDDYSGVLRYIGNPIPSMQSLDQHNRVIYIGSFQTLLSTGIKMSFMILPPALLKVFEEKKHEFDHTVSKLIQLTLAEYMIEGHFDRHIKRLRSQLAKKSEILKDCLDKTSTKYTDFQAGTFIIIHGSKTEIDLYMKRASQQEILLTPYYELGFVLFHYRGLTDTEIPKYVKSIFT